MPVKTLVLLASRALSLNLVITSVLFLFQVSQYVFYAFHYWSAYNRTAEQNFILNYYILAIAVHLAGSAAMFVASVWLYRCGPSVEKFLSPQEQ